jgi:hypothetical protein
MSSLMIWRMKLLVPGLSIVIAWAGTRLVRQFTGSGGQNERFTPSASGRY